MSHLKDANLSWGRHLYFAWSISFRLIVLSIAGIIHGVFPFICTKTVSNGIYDISNNELGMSGISYGGTE